MSDQSTFEPTLARELRAFAEDGVRPIDARAIALQLLADRPTRPAPALRIGRGTVIPLRLLAAATLLLLAMLAALALTWMGHRPVELTSNATSQPNVVDPTPDLPVSDASLDGAIAVSAPDGIYTVHLDGTTTRLALDGATDTSCPTFSPDVALLAVHLYDPIADSHNLTLRKADGVMRGMWDGQMSNSFHQIRWSADGSTVMLNGILGGPNGVQTFIGRPFRSMEEDGDRRLYDWWGGELAGSFALSPDGRQLAVIVPDGQQGRSRIEIHDLRTDTTRTLVRGLLSEVAWSPDGTTISYAAAEAAGAPADLHFVNVDGTNDRLILRGEPASIGMAFMAWSGTWIRLGEIEGMRLGVIERFGAQIRVHVLDTAGREIALIGPFGASPNLTFTWAPGGDAVLFTTSAGTGGLTGGPPMLAYLDGRAFKPGLPANVASSCPLGWAKAGGW